MSYNGWTNYETWCVALWLGNYGIDADHFDGVDDVEDLAQAIKDLVEDNAPYLGASLYADLLVAAISETNWYEIAKAWIEDKEQ